MSQIPARQNYQPGCVIYTIIIPEVSLSVQIKQRNINELLEMYYHSLFKIFNQFK